MSDPYRKLAEAHRRMNAASFAPLIAPLAAQVSSVVYDSLGNPSVAIVTIDGQGQFDVNVTGKAVAPGESIMVGIEVNNPTGKLVFIEHMSSDIAGVGLARGNPGPPPDYASTWYTTLIQISPGSITTKVTIYLDTTGIIQYQPMSHIVSYQVDGEAEWSDVEIPHLGGEQSVTLPRSFQPGVDLNVHLRSRYAFAIVPSEPSEDRVVSVAGNTGSPGIATALTKSVLIAGRIRLEAFGTVDDANFLGWRYEIATSAGGAGLVTKTVKGPLDYEPPTSGSFYVAVSPVSLSGVLGTRFPGVSSFDGPYVVTPAAIPSDTTPPPVWGAPTLTSRQVQLADGSPQAFLIVTFPAYTYPSDYQTTVVRYYDGTRYDFMSIPYNGVAHSPVEIPVAYGTWTVDIKGFDKAGNSPVGFGTTASLSIAAPGIPGTPATLTVAQIGLALRISWAMPTGSEWIELERATDLAGSNAVSWLLQGTFWIDVFTDQAVSLTAYYYRYRGHNKVGPGPWTTPRVGGTVQPLTGSFLVADSVTATQIAAQTITGAEIAASVILASLLKTAASGTRWELEGHTGGGIQDQFRFYEFSTGADRLRMLLTGAGLDIYNDAAVARMTLDKNGLTLKRDSGATRMTLDQAALMFYNDAAVERAKLNASGLFISNDSAANRVIFSPGSGGTMQIITDEIPLTLGDTTGGTFSVGHAFLSASKKTHIALSGNGLYFSGAGNAGTMSGEWYRLQNDGGIGWGVGAQHYMTLLRAADRFGNNDTMQLVTNTSAKGRLVAGDITSYRATTAHGIVWLGDGSGGDRYIFWNGSNYVMPGAQATINGVNVGSARSTKKGIRKASIDLAKAFLLLPSRFRFTEDGDSDPLRMGFVAEDVREAIPEASVDFSDSLDPLGKPIFGGLGYSLEGLIAAQQAMIHDLHSRLMRVERGVV